MQLRAPAKINLSFRVLGRRADGFHEIETLMAPVSLFDVVTLTLSDDRDITFACDDAGLPTGGDNLAVRAAQLFFAATKLESGVQIDLQKNIPHGAGLGGGSSDAATVLLGLNRLYETQLTPATLNELGASIGSDVPFFLAESCATCGGRGELVTHAHLPQTVELLLLKPAFGVPTPWAYSRWRDSSELPRVSYSAQEFGGITFVNDLERPVFEKYLFLGQMKMWLLAQPEVGAATLSGSGSTILAALSNGANAEALSDRAKTELDPELWTCQCATL